jgi:hypothetical protein
MHPATLTDFNRSYRLGALSGAIHSTTSSARASYLTVLGIDLRAQRDQLSMLRRLGKYQIQAAKTASHVHMRRIRAPMSTGWTFADLPFVTVVASGQA